MRISEFARRAGVSVQALRFYEREGLLPEPPRTPSGYREYGFRDLERIKLIRSCQELGFTLKDINEVMELHRVMASSEHAEGLKPKAQARLLAMAARRLALIDEKVRTLMQMRIDMAALVATLQGREKPVCPVSGIRVT
jgi:DNA-binding transcriptional MerR regulator